MLYSIGYGNGDFDALIARLSKFEITHLVDVRTNPYSRYQPDFRGEDFAARVRSTGMKYIFMGDRLGGKPDDASVYTGGRLDADKMLAAPWFLEGIAKLEAALSHNDWNICLLCGCAKPEECHRGRILAPFLLEHGFDCSHILSDDSLVTESQIRAERHPTLF